MGLFDETSETPANRERHQADNGKDASLFEWLVRKAETDLGLAQAFAAGEAQRADRIKRLEITLVGQISALQHQIVEGREAELHHLRSDISACLDRLGSAEAAKAANDAARESIQDKLGTLDAQLSDRQSALEDRHSGFEKLGESLSAQIRGLEEHLAREIDGVGTLRAELRHWKSEAKSLTDRIGQAESNAWQNRSLASRNAEEIEQIADSLKSEIVALKALFAELGEQQRDLQMPDTLFKEMTRSLGAKIEDILGQLAQEHHVQIERDARFEDLESELTMLEDRLAKTERSSREIHALARTEAESTSDLRAQVAKELEILHAKINEAQAHLPAMANLETMFHAKLDEWQQWAAQKFMLLENRYIEQAKNAGTLGAKLAEHEEHTAQKLGSLASAHEKLVVLEPEIRMLAQRTGQLESAAQAAQGQADASAMRVRQVEESLNCAITGLKAEIAAISEQQQAVRQPDEEMRELERKLGAKIDDLQHQLAMEREGFDRWGKGLRESFGDELGAMQARLSERQSQIEYRYSRLDRLEEAVKASMLGLETQLHEKLQAQEHDNKQWTKLSSDVGALGERADRLESRAREIEDRVAATGEELEKSCADLQNDMSAIKGSVDRRAADFSESVIHRLEEVLRADLSRLEEQVNQRFNVYDSRDGDRAQQTAQAINGLKGELESFRAFHDQQPAGGPSAESLAHDLQKSLETRIFELDHKFADRFALLDSRDAEGTRRAHETAAALQCGIAALQGEITALKNGIGDRPESSADSALRGLEESFGAKIQDLQQQMAQKLDLFDQRDAERIQVTEQRIAGLAGEMTALKTELSRPALISAEDPALRALQDSLSARIHEIHQQVAENVSLLESRDGELKELNDRSQSLIQRVAQLASAIHEAQSAAEPAAQSAPARQVTVREPETIAATGESDKKAHAPNEKEQLNKLQERMSTEIERVRAELKERSGRWKVRKSAS